jgi:N12 class adenine-specific DNA methylase
VSIFVPSPEIEDRNAVEVDNWAKTFYSEYTYTILSLSRSQVALILQFSNFKATVESITLPMYFQQISR